MRSTVGISRSRFGVYDSTDTDVVIIVNAQHRVHLRRGLPLGAHHYVRVEIGRDGNRAVAEDLLDDLQIKTLSKQQRSASVAEIMESLVRQALALQNLLERFGRHLGIHRATGEVGEDEA
jgi:hypothetical protein